MLPVLDVIGVVDLLILHHSDHGACTLNLLQGDLVDLLQSLLHLLVEPLLVQDDLCLSK